MLVKDLPDDTQLDSVKIRIPDKYKEEWVRVGLNTNEVYLKSAWHNGVWVAASLNDGRVFPLPIHVEKILEWEVVDELCLGE